MYINITFQYYVSIYKYYNIQHLFVSWVVILHPVIGTSSDYSYLKPYSEKCTWYKQFIAIESSFQVSVE